MKNLMLGAAALALITGCGGSGGDTPGMPSVDLAELTVRDGDPAKAGDALAAMALSEGATGVLTAAERSVNGDDATFTNVTITGTDDIQIGTLVFEGLDMDGSTATFGKMSFNDISIAPEGDAPEVKVGDRKSVV